MVLFSDSVFGSSGTMRGGGVGGGQEKASHSDIHERFHQTLLIHSMG